MRLSLAIVSSCFLMGLPQTLSADTDRCLKVDFIPIVDSIRLSLQESKRIIQETLLSSIADAGSFTLGNIRHQWWGRFPPILTDKLSFQRF